MGELVGEYYFVLRSIVREQPELRPLLVRCRHCGIFFFADPRNRGRKDLGCPFGCREAHRKKCSSERSTKYNRGEVGRKKKKIYNARRSRAGSKALGPKEPPQDNAAWDGSQLEQPEMQTRAPEVEPEGPKTEPGPLEFHAAIVAYVRLTTRLIDGRWVSREEIIEMLARAGRQRSMGRERRIDYVVRYLNERPP